MISQFGDIEIQSVYGPNAILLNPADLRAKHLRCFLNHELRSPGQSNLIKYRFQEFIGDGL